jgi:phosphoglycerate dehydrogenase-like enzyme
VVNEPGAEPWPGLDRLAECADIVHTNQADQLAGAIPDADILLVTDFRTRWLSDAVPRAGRLRWVHATSAGLDAILVPAVIERGLPVTNARGVFDQAIAEHVVGVILAFAKDLRRSFDLMAERRWLHRETERVAGRRLLVVGAGSIGRQIARYGRGIGLEVEGIARRRRNGGDPDFTQVHGPEDLLARLPDADFVAIAAPLTPATEGLFGAEELGRMKRSARLINVARGPIVQTAALIEALERGGIAGAALDVFEQEPLPAESPLWRMPQVIVTAHMAGDFIGWKQALTDQFAALFHRWRRGEPLPEEGARP